MKHHRVPLNLLPPTHPPPICNYWHDTLRNAKTRYVSNISKPIQYFRGVKTGASISSGIFFARTEQTFKLISFDSLAIELIARKSLEFNSTLLTLIAKFNNAIDQIATNGATVQRESTSRFIRIMSSRVVK